MKKADSNQSTGGRKESAFGVYSFLLIVVVIYLLVFLFEIDRTLVALQFSWNMLLKLLPVLAMVSIFMFLNNLFVKPSWVKNQVGHDSGWKGTLIAVVGGTVSMGPIYVWYGMLRDFQKKGMRTSLIATFLYARSVKPQLLPLMVYYFGWLYTLILVVYLIAFSVFNGLAMGRLMRSARNHIE
jgi:uncharacterized membrane protein YraQ (UPF0718 family)